VLCGKWSNRAEQWPMDDNGTRDRLIGATVFAAACVAAYVAWVSEALLSSGESGSHGTPLLTAQLVVALAGLIPAGLFARALNRHDERQTVLWLAIGIVVYVAWGVLNDAAVHGWSHLNVF
jgi:hypothetical protein